MNLEIRPKIKEGLKSIGRATALFSVTALLLTGCDRNGKPKVVANPLVEPTPTLLVQDSENPSVVVNSIIDIVDRDMVDGLTKQQHSISTETKDGVLVTNDALSIRVESFQGARHILEATVDLEDKGRALIYLVPRVLQPRIEKNPEGNHLLVIPVAPIIYGITDSEIFSTDDPADVQKILDGSPTAHGISPKDFFLLTGATLESTSTDTTFGNFVFAEGAFWKFDSETRTWSIQVVETP